MIKQRRCVFYLSGCNHSTELSFNCPVVIPTQTAVTTNEIQGTLAITAKLPVQPLHRNLGGTTTVFIHERATMAPINVSHRYRHMNKALVIIHAIGIGNICFPAENINNRSMDIGKCLFSNIHVRNGNRRGFVEDTRIVHHQGFYPGISSNLVYLYTTTTESGQRHLVRINATVVRTFGALVFCHRPVNGLTQ